ncbi:MAG: insulinase family protein [Hyphomicrobiaceae bacterium]
MTTTHGFEEIARTRIDEINSEARFYRHSQSGAELLSLLNDDENKVFGITFRTPPVDSTGIAHILEHSVLCGSEKFPVKDPFIRLAQGSLNTFLNAMTYPDKTTYPTASQNLQDFYNLIDVYLDAVLHPRITREILEQEGWHYEITDDKTSLRYKGVVFNEMKGAYSSPDAILHKLSQQSLFPNTTYGVDSGGDPVEIPNLTYEAFREFHDRNYHPSNARIYFYGDDDPIERLRLLDERLSAFTRSSVNSNVPLQERFSAPIHVEGTFPAGDGAEASNSHLALNWMLDEIADPEQAIALRVLDQMMTGTPAAPLRKKIMESGLGEEVISSIDFDYRQATALCGLKGIKAADADKVETLILDTLQHLSTNGFDRSTIDAALNTIEFRLRENNTGSFPRGLSLMLRALTTWLYDRDPLERIAFAEPLDRLKARVEAGERVFEPIVQEWFVDNPHRSSVLVKPDHEQSAREIAEERARLDTRQTEFSQDEIDQLIKQTAELKRWQETPDTPEAIATIPMLKRSDLPKSNTHIPSERSHIAGVEVLSHDLLTNGILYADLAFDLHALPLDLLPTVSVFGRALLETGAGDLDFVALSERIGRTTGGITVSPYVSAASGGSGSVAQLILRAKSMPDKAPELISILRDIMLTPRLNDRERVYQIVLEEKASAEARLIPMGHLMASRRVSAGLSEAGFVEEKMSGVTRLLALRKLAERIEADWPSVAADLEMIRQQLITRAGLVASLTGEGTALTSFNRHLEARLGTIQATPVQNSPNWERNAVPLAEGLAVPAKVNFVSKGANLRTFGFEPTGAALVAQNLLSTTWLWDKVRLQGGAYGGFCRFDRHSGSFIYASYRDPNLLETLEVFDNTANYLKRTELTEQDLTRAIIGTIGSIDAYLLPDLKGLASLQRHLTGDSDAARQKMRDEVLATSKSDLNMVADALAELARDGRVAIMGSGEALAEANNVRGGSWLNIEKVL